MSLPSQKRQRLDSQPQTPLLSEPERKLYELIKSKTNMGIWTADMKRETDLQQNVVTKCLKSLQNKNLIKVVVNVRNKSKKYFMGVEFVPSNEVTGGTFYSAEGKLDDEFIAILKTLCLKHIDKHRDATVEDIWKAIVASAVVNKDDCDVKHVEVLCSSLVFEKEIEELKSTGVGDLKNVRSDQKRYRRRSKEDVKSKALSSVPCGVCPRISDCTEVGLISPKTCVYYDKWLELDF